jgi:hypothetical protein
MFSLANAERGHAHENGENLGKLGLGFMFKNHDFTILPKNQN